MARARDDGIVWYHHPKYRSASVKEIAANIYPDLARKDHAASQVRHQLYRRELEYVDHVLRTNVDVPDDEPRTQPPRRSTDAEIAYRLWGREQEREANEAAQQDIRQRWIDCYRENSIFERKRR
jgi:hypothetical protein